MYNWARNIVLLMILGKLVSCQSQPFELDEPNDLVPRDTMIMVLKDLSLIEAHLQTEYVQLSNYYRSLKLSGDAILQKYHLSTSRVEESLVYYGSIPKCKRCTLRFWTPWMYKRLNFKRRTLLLLFSQMMLRRSLTLNDKSNADFYT